MLHLRFAAEADIPLILQLIRGLAIYEKMEEEMVATPELLRHWLFQEKKAEVLIGEEAGETIGFALFFHNFSTFVGKAGLYLEDLYILEAYRGKGYGRAFFKSWGPSP